MLKGEMFSKNFPHVVHQKMLSLEIQLIQRCIRLVRIVYTASTGAATADTALYTANSALIAVGKWYVLDHNIRQLSV